MFTKLLFINTFSAYVVESDMSTEYVDIF